MRSRSITGLVITALISGTLHGAVTSYRRTVPIGVDFIRGGNMCGGISANLEAGEFFEGLQGRNTPNGRQFRRMSHPVELYPEKLMVRVRVYTSRCVGQADPHQRTEGVQPEFSFDRDFINSLQFRAFWKNGFLMKKADLEIFTSGESRIQGYVSRVGTLAWEYDLQILCPTIPLTDTLVVEVLSPSGKLVSRFAKKL